MWLIPTSAQGGGSRGGGGSAVHRSRRAGAGVLTYFAGAGVCSPPVNLRQHLFVLQTIIVLQRKNFSPSTKNRQCFFLAGLPFLDKVIITSSHVHPVTRPGSLQEILICGYPTVC